MKPYQILPEAVGFYTMKEILKAYDYIEERCKYDDPEEQSGVNCDRIGSAMERSCDKCLFSKIDSLNRTDNFICKGYNTLNDYKDALTELIALEGYNIEVYKELNGGYNEQ